MEYLRGKIKSRTPSIGTDDYNQDSWRTRSVLRRRDDIYNSAYSRPSSSSRSNAVFSSRYKSPMTNSYGSDSLTKKYSSYSPSPLQSPKIVRTRKLSILDNIRNSEIDERKQSEKESPCKEKGNNDEDEDDQVNYKELYEKEKKEKEICESKLKDLEQHFQVSLQRFLELKKILDGFQEEIEITDESINSFLQSIIPDFPSWENEGDVQECQNNTNVFKQEVQEESCLQEIEDKKISGRTLLPRVDYEWIEVAQSKPPLYVKHLKRFTNASNSRTEKLKLNLIFEGDSHELPTKLHIEIKDSKGRVVFRKRQNVYYVKLQEDISTLNSEEDYFMTISSIYGTETEILEMTIHHRGYDQERAESSLLNIRSPSEVSQTSGFDERSLESALQSPRIKEASLELDSFVITDTPLPDLEEITGNKLEKNTEDATDNEEDIDDDFKNNEVSESSRKNSFLLVKRLILPEVMYKWHRGFRRDINGRYIKVTVLKLQIKYEDCGGVMPWELHIYFLTAEGEESENYKVVPISDNIATVEFTVNNEEKILMKMYSKEKSGQDHITAPTFTISPEMSNTVTLGEWHLVQPVVK